ncbi:MAG: FAD-binding oxidoreductase [Candidatus Sungbacteria bacterium]|nr:FAD-binding oxidoreductase [Candidatus Sungbacteria bacterium]
MASQDLVLKIKEFFKGDVNTDAETLTRYSRDASLFEVRPEIVVFPKDSGDIKNLVKFVNEQKRHGVGISLTPRSAGTDMSGGPLSSSIVVDVTKYMNRIKEIGDGYAVAEPGVFYRDFEKETLARGFLLPSYPASREMCALGGMVANNAGGEKSLSYGKTDQYVEELKVVLADGEEHVFRPLSMQELEEKKQEASFEGTVYKKIADLVENHAEVLRTAKPKVSKNSTGYLLWDIYDKSAGTFNLSRVFVGSQGTLGIITEIKFKLIRPKLHSRLLVIFLPSVSALAGICGRVLEHHPESFESYDDNTFKVALKFFPAVAKSFHASLLRLAIDFLPEFRMVLTGGIPKLVLIAEFTGDTPEEATRKAEEAKKDILSFGFPVRVTRSEREAKKYWTLRRESYNILRHHVKGLRTAPFIDDFVIEPNRLPEFLPRLYGILDKYNLVYTVAGHVGDGNFHIIPLMNLASPDVRQTIKNLSGEVYKLVFEFGGSMSGEHNDGLIRGAFLRMMYGDEVFRLFEETKRVFDTDGIFNPGKKTEAALEYALDHIVKK